MDGFWTTVISVIGALTAVGSVMVIFYKSRGENKNVALSTKAALDARIDERVSAQLKSAWEQIDTLNGKVETLENQESKYKGAITRILRDIARQWPNPEGPLLNPVDIAEISETVPPSWIRVKN